MHFKVGIFLVNIPLHVCPGSTINAGVSFVISHVALALQVFGHVILVWHYSLIRFIMTGDSTPMSSSFIEGVTMCLATKDFLPVFSSWRE